MQRAAEFERVREGVFIEKTRERLRQVNSPTELAEPADEGTEEAHVTDALKALNERITRLAPAILAGPAGVEVRMTVRNAGPEAIVDITPSAPVTTGSGTLSPISTNRSAR